MSHDHSAQQNPDKKAVEKTPKAEFRYSRDIWLKFVEHRLAVFGLGVLLLLLLTVIFLPLFMELKPYESDYTAFSAPPSEKFLLGTDSIGRDVFARLIYGGRTSLFVGLLSPLLALLIGLPLGLLAAYYRKRVESIIMRATDVFMSFPSIVLILILATLVGPTIWAVTLVIGFLNWTQFTRIIYANALQVRESEYVESAYAIGLGTREIIMRYLLPNAFPPVLVTISFMTGSAIILEASLSFMGLGVQSPAASWGNMLYDAQSIAVLAGRPWQWIPPGLCLVLTVLCINFVGDGLRQALDPKGGYGNYF